MSFVATASHVSDSPVEYEAVIACRLRARSAPRRYAEGAAAIRALASLRPLIVLTACTALLPCAASPLAVLVGRRHVPELPRQSPGIADRSASHPTADRARSCTTSLCVRPIEAPRQVPPLRHRGFLAARACLHADAAAATTP